MYSKIVPSYCLRVSTNSPFSLSLFYIPLQGIDLLFYGNIADLPQHTPKVNNWILIQTTSLLWRRVNATRERSTYSTSVAKLVYEYVLRTSCRSKTCYAVVVVATRNQFCRIFSLVFNYEFITFRQRACAVYVFKKYIVVFCVLIVRFLLHNKIKVVLWIN